MPVVKMLRGELNAYPQQLVNWTIFILDLYVYKQCSADSVPYSFHSHIVRKYIAMVLLTKAKLIP